MNICSFYFDQFAKDDISTHLLWLVKKIFKIVDGIMVIYGNDILVMF